MTARVAHIWRHPIKSHGREALDRVSVSAGASLPWDRAWAVVHAAANVTDGSWAPCGNFLIGSKSPALMAIGSRLDESTGRIVLTHPDRPDLAFDPDTEAERFLDWVRPLANPDRSPPSGLVRSRDRGMTDTDFPSVSILNLASLRALEGRAGRTLSPERFRGNIWLDGLGPWEEFEWIGRTVRIGSAEFRIEERIERCTATSTDPATGRRDMDTPGTLEAGWGHRDFGVYSTPISGGSVALGDTAELVA